MKFSYKDLTERFASLLGGQEEKPKEEAKPAVETAEATPQNDEGFQAFASAVTKAIETLATKIEADAKENASLKTSLANVQSEVANLKKMPVVAETAVSGVVDNLPTKTQDAFSEEVNQRIESLKYAETQLEMYRKAGLV